MSDVKIVLEAQDKASAVLEQVAKKVEDNVKQIRSTGEATKKSTELVGTFANALGDTGLGSFAGQLGGIIEKASAFSETMKDGAGNSLECVAGRIEQQQAGRIFGDRQQVGRGHAHAEGATLRLGAITDQEVDVVFADRVERVGVGAVGERPPTRRHAIRQRRGFAIGDIV